MDTNTARARRTEAEEFATRCRNALTLAYQDRFGLAEEIESLKEALADALEAKADWDRILGE